MKTQKQIPVTSYKASGFTEKYQNIVHSTVIQYQYSVLWDKADGAEKNAISHRGKALEAFLYAWKEAGLC